MKTILVLGLIFLGSTAYSQSELILKADVILNVFCPDEEKQLESNLEAPLRLAPEGTYSGGKSSKEATVGGSSWFVSLNVSQKKPNDILFFEAVVYVDNFGAWGSTFEIKQLSELPTFSSGILFPLPNKCTFNFEMRPK